MSGLLELKNTIRGFCRKKDEIISPAFRFIWSLIIFMSIQKLFNYSSLGAKAEVTILLAVLSALLPEGFMFFMAGALIALHCFSVSPIVGAVIVLLFVIMYCTYVRFFPDYAYALLIVPVFYVLKIPFAAPIVVAIIVGIGGAVPSVFGVILYYFSECVSTVNHALASDSEVDVMEITKQISEVFLNNKEMYTVCVIFGMTVIVTSLLAKLTFDYGVYIAIAAGTIVNIIGSIVAGAITGKDVDMGLVLIGSIVGALIALVVRFGQGILDYKHVERVQFEDDDYYYYVKAVPKIDSEKKDHNKKSLAQDQSSLMTDLDEMDKEMEKPEFKRTPEKKFVPDLSQMAQTPSVPDMMDIPEFSDIPEMSGSLDIPSANESKKSRLHLASNSDSNRNHIQMPPGYNGMNDFQ